MKRSVVFPVLIISSLTIVILAVNVYSDDQTEYEEEYYPIGEKKIERTFKSENEMKAIDTAEHLSLIDIYNKTRFTLGEDTNDPTKATEPDWICYFRIIDHVTIETFSKRFDHVNGINEYPKSLFQYIVECEMVLDLNIILDNYSLTLTVGEDVIDLTSVGWTSYFQLEDMEILAPWVHLLINNEQLPSNFTIHLDEAYIVDQFMWYSERMDAHSGFGNDMIQLIILDQDMNIIMIHTRASLGWMGCG